MNPYAEFTVLAVASFLFYFNPLCVIPPTLHEIYFCYMKETSASTVHTTTINA